MNALLFSLLSLVLISWTSSADTAPRNRADVVINAECTPGDFTRTVEEAWPIAFTGLYVKVILPPCVYREQAFLSWLGLPIPESMKLEIIASRTGKTIISGSDIFDSWTFVADDVWEAPWPYKLFDPEPGWSFWFPAAPELVKRTEIFFVDGDRLEQVVSYADLVDSSFFIDESSERVFLKLLSDPNESLVEGAVRSFGLKTQGVNNLTVRGLVFQHAASTVNRSSAVRFTNFDNILLDRVTIRDNSGTGLHTGVGGNVIVRNSAILDNGLAGWSAFKINGLIAENIVVRGTNWRGHPSGLAGGITGGMKHGAIHNGVYRRLRVVDNLSRGLWLDTDIRDILVERSRFKWNTEAIFIEAVQGPVTVRDNRFESNQVGIMGDESRNVTILGNLLKYNTHSQLFFRSLEGVGFTDFESGEFIVPGIDDWTFENNNFWARGAQIIVGRQEVPGGVLPTNSVSFRNFCRTESPTVDDTLVC